jgi:hypothetical protein
MPTWTLRLVACAGFVALLSRLPAIDSAADAFLLGSVAGAFTLGAHFGPIVVRALRERLRLPLTHSHPVLPSRFHPAHGADA